MTRVFPAFIVLLFLVTLAPGQQATTPTLRLAEVFDLRPAMEGTFIAARPRYDPSGPALFIPDTAAWRVPRTPVPPTPAPSPTPYIGPEGEPLSIPRLPLMVGKTQTDTDKMDQPAFDFRGMSFQGVATGHARLAIQSGFRQLRTRYTLEGAGEPLVFLHTPGTVESFDVPSGRYRLIRQMWRTDNPQRFLREIYDWQQLAASGLYEFNANPRTEADLLAALKAPE